MRNTEALKHAVALAEAGDWDAAHAIAQRHGGVAPADWLHAVLHRIEGDMGNARYWYRRAGRDPGAFATTADELTAIARSLA